MTKKDEAPAERTAVARASAFAGMPKVDPADPRQNAFVQDWLTAWAKEHIAEPIDDDWQTYESAVEMIQETYSPPAEPTSDR